MRIFGNHLRWPKNCRAALATPVSRFERLMNSNAPGFAGGWLLATNWKTRVAIYSFPIQIVEYLNTDQSY